MTPALDAALALALAVLAYAWLLYPALVRRAAAGRPARRGEAPLDPLPRVAVLVSAFNEEKEIGDRIGNLLLQDIPADRLRVLVGMDGCTDGTEAAVRTWAASDARVLPFAFRVNRGKLTVLKDLVAACAAGDGRVFADGRPDVLLFTDANTFFRRDAVRELLAPLSDPAIGGVCGRLVFTEFRPTSPEAVLPENPASEGFYWRWETRLKTDESRLDSCLGANGGIYAVRRELFPVDVPDNTVVDDFTIGVKVREQGWRMVYRPEAVGCEELPHEKNEWRRRVRIGAGDYQALLLCRRCMLPRFGWFAWCFWSHKVLRWFTPHLGLAVLALALGRLAMGAGRGWWLAAVTVSGAAAFLLLAALGGRVRLGSLARHFALMQLALLLGFFRFLRGDLKGAWTPTPRKTE